MGEKLKLNIGSRIWFLFYWYSTMFSEGDAVPQRAMAFWGLSPALSEVLARNPETTALARRFNRHARFAMGLGLSMGLLIGVPLGLWITEWWLNSKSLAGLMSFAGEFGGFCIVGVLLGLGVSGLLVNDLYDVLKRMVALYNGRDSSEQE